MKKMPFPFLVGAFFLLFPITTLTAQKSAIFSYTMEVELNNDQGDMPTKDYLKNYGTKGKKQGVEIVSEATIPFMMEQFRKAGMEVLAIDTMSTLKANEYGRPAVSLAKAAASGLADRYIKIYIKDITIPLIEGITQQDLAANARKQIRMRCRIHIYGSDKSMIREVEGIFQSGDKIDNPTELGVDLRKYQGSEFLQELKIYETCTKMAIIKAINLLKE